MRRIRHRSQHAYRILAIAAVLTACLHVAALAQKPKPGKSSADFEARFQSHIEKARYGVALRIARDYAAAVERREGKKSVAYATALSHQAHVLMLLNAFERAQRLFNEALEIYRASADSRAIARTLNNIGEANKFAGKKKAAEDFYDKALAIQEQSLPADDVDVAITLANLSQIKDDLPIRERLLERALAIQEKALGESDLTIAGTLQSLAAVLEDQRRAKEAEEHLRRALSIRRARQPEDSPYLAGAMHKLGNNLYRQGRHGEAEELLKQALQFRLKSRSFFLDTGRNLTDLAQIYLSQPNRSNEAEDALLKALKFYRMGLPEDHSYFADAYHNLAYAEGDRSRYGKALNWSRKSSAIGISRQRELSDDDKGKESQFHFFDHVKYAWENYHAKQPRALLDEAFLIAQHASASDTAASVARMSARLAARNPALAVITREKQDLEAKRREAGHELIAAMAQAQSERASAIRKERDSLSVRIATADERIRREFPQYQSLVVPAPLSATAVQSELQPEEALIYFLQTYDDVFVWVITREQAEWKKLALDVSEIERQVALLRASLEIFAPMSVPSSERFDLDTAHLLYQHLFSPVALGLAGKQKLIVVTHGSLATLPFQTLVASAPSTGGQRDIAAYADADWLVNRYAISVLPAVTNIKSLRHLRPGSPTRKEMVGFGNPEFQPRTVQPGQHVSRHQATCRVARGVSIDPAELRQLEPLPCTETELLGVGAFMGSGNADLYFGASASEAKLKRINLADYKIVYFATHGGLIGNEGVLVLTIPEQPSSLDDGILTASEIAELRLDADWVVLSACNTAAGNGRGAEALSGLARAFLYAGSRALLVSHWEVSDEAAVSLLIGAFEALQESPGLGRAGSLRQSMRRMISEKRNSWWVYPSYWAVYFVVGLPD